MTTKKPFSDSAHLKRWQNAGPEKNLIWLDSAIKFAKAKKHQSHHTKLLGKTKIPN
jgi:hypothetical protein